MSELLITRHDRVLQLTLNRPQARNALNNTLLLLLAEALESAAAEAVSGHFEAGALLDATVHRQITDYALTELDLAGQRLTLPHIDAAAGTPVRLRVRARDVALALARVDRPEVDAALGRAVGAVVFWRGSDALGLQGADVGDTQPRGQEWILAVVLLDAAPAGIA